MVKDDKLLINGVYYWSGAFYAIQFTLVTRRYRKRIKIIPETAKQREKHGLLFTRNLIKLRIDKLTILVYYNICNLVKVPKGAAMELKSLSEVINFSLGKNPTRIKEQELSLYSPENFESDLYCINEHDKRSACIINLIKSKAAPVSMDNADKCITSNFLKCEFDGQILDKWYFCYQFNEGKYLEQQIAMFHQGTTLSVKKLNVKTIGELKIRLPDIDKQRKIGELYRQSLIQNCLMIKQTEDIKNLTLSIIRKIEED